MVEKISSRPAAKPVWMGLRIALALAAQAVAAVLVLGSYFLARYLQVWRPHRRAAISARPPEAAPAALSEVAP
jgi:high-affinity iron transporter